jgi:sugar phosphate permease
MQRALAADLSPKEVLGTAMGTFNTLTGVALLPASLIAGALWNIAPKGTWPFWFGAITGLLAAILLAVVPLTRREEKVES